MRYVISAAATICVSASMAAVAQSKPSPSLAVGGTCTTLMREYDGASMDLAGTFAESVGDNSAPRATLRQMEDANSLAIAKIALDLMRDNHCPMPNSAPTMVPYVSQALACATDRLKGSGSTSPASCDRASWMPSSH